MKLKTFNAENCVSSRTLKPSVRICTKSGVISFNKEAASRMNLNDGDQVTIHQSEEEESDWFVSKVNESGFQLRAATQGGSLLFNNTTLCRMIADSVNYIGQSGKLMVGSEPVTSGEVKYWPLITASLRNK